MKIAKKPTLSKPKENSVEVLTDKPKYTDLRQVMDYSRPLSIFYSGVEYESYLDILYSLGIRNFLMSYEYLKGKGHAQLKKYSDMHLFIDSGAFTYMSDPKYESYTIEQWEEQIEEYLRWAERHKDSIFAIADLDLQYIVGYEKVYEWRKKYFEPFMLRTGIPVCFIYHEDGLDVWEYMCKRYPYVGFSLATDVGANDVELREKFRIAEKYNTLIQGMASTKTSMLTEFPFYTVDSTTWNVGLKYGEISVWKGSKMSRIKKADFETKAFPVISKYDRSFDFDLIRDEDKTEMIKVNAYAFVQAEKYIHDRLKSKMYWLKARTEKRDLDNLPDDFYPSEDTVLNGTDEEVLSYAKKFNINPEAPEAMDLVVHITAFMNWDNPDYVSLRGWYDEHQNTIDELHDIYINRIVGSNDDKIYDLQKFFGECLSGDNDKLLQLGTNFDRVIKERETYIEDEESETVELTPSEVKKSVKALLPEPSGDSVDDYRAPEIDELDEEIFKKANIVPVYDEKGRFLKGQTQVRKPKKVYSKKYPKFACDSCASAAKCPEYKSGYVCAYDKLFNRFDTRDMSDIIQATQGIVEYNMARMQRAMVMETMNGVIDPVVTNLMSQNVQYMQLLKQMYETGSSEVLKQTRVIRADGSTEETTTVSNPKSGGILEKLVGSLSVEKDPPKENPENLVEVEATENKTEKETP